jgi:hypothetical protein
MFMIIFFINFINDVIWLDQYTVKPALNGPFIKRKSVLNGNVFRSLDWLNYYSIPWLNGNLVSAEKFSGPLRFRLRRVLLYLFPSMNLVLSY